MTVVAPPAPHPEAGETPPGRLGLWVVFLLSLLFTAAPLAGYDFWFYLAVGRDVASSGRIPFEESYLGNTAEYAFGRYADQAWLGNLVCWWTYAALGAGGLVLLKSLLLALTASVTYLNCLLLRPHPAWAAAWTLLGLWTIRGRFEMRTYLFTDLMIALLLWLLLQAWRQPEQPRWRWLLPLHFILWSNLHQGVVAGGYLMLFWTLSGVMPARRGLPLLALCGLATFVRPYGQWLPAFLIDHFANRSAITGVLEWGAPPWSVILGQLGPMLVLLGFLLPGAVARAYRSPAARRPPWGFLLTASLFLVLGLRSMRAISELLPVVCPLMFAYFPCHRFRARLLPTAWVALAAAWLMVWQPPSWSRLSSVQSQYPMAAAAGLKPSVQVLNSFEFGNLLVFLGHRPFLHGMTAFYREDLILDYTEMVNNGPRTGELLDRFQVDQALLHFPGPLDGTEALLERLASQPDWSLQAWDDQAMVWYRAPKSSGWQHLQPWRRGAPWRDARAAAQELSDRLPQQPSARGYTLLSRALLESGEEAAAGQAVEQALRLSPDLYDAWAQYGLLAARRGQVTGLLRATEQQVRLAPTFAPARLQRAQAWLAWSQEQSGWKAVWGRLQARYQARQALWIQPDFGPARTWLEQTSAR